MNNPQAARFLLALTIALISSNCSSPQEPFFRYNSPFKKEGLVSYDGIGNNDIRGDRERAGTPSASENQPTPYFADDQTSEPELPDLPVEQVAATGAETPAAPEIQILKRGPAGSVCFTCRGKGYVFQPTTDSTGDNHECPSCGGDGRN